MRSKYGRLIAWSPTPATPARTMPPWIACASIREFGFKIPVLARSDGEVVDGHLRLKAARKLGSWPGGDTADPGDPLRRVDRRRR